VEKITLLHLSEDETVWGIDSVPSNSGGRRTHEETVIDEYKEGKYPNSLGAFKPLIRKTF